MTVFKSESISEYSELKSNDEQEFYHLVAKYFFERAADYHDRYTVIFFSGDDGDFEITSKISFESYKELKDFHQKVSRRDYHFILGQYNEGFEFIFNGKFQFGVEGFGQVRKIIFLKYDQNLRDVIEGRKQLPPRTNAFRDMIIGKALEQHAAETQQTKRKLAS